MVALQDCGYCGQEFEDVEEQQHYCGECDEMMSSKECQEGYGTCRSCTYIIHKL